MERKLTRSRGDRKIAGVCGGAAQFLGVDATIIRLIWAVMALFYGSGLLLYILAAIIIPQEEMF